jgi:hypothetical protein
LSAGRDSERTVRSDGGIGSGKSRGGAEGCVRIGGDKGGEHDSSAVVPQVPKGSPIVSQSGVLLGDGLSENPRWLGVPEVANDRGDI